MFEKIREGLQSVIQTIGKQNAISEKNVRSAIERLKETLLDADVNVKVVRRFINQTLEEALGEKVIKSVSPNQMFVKLLHDKLCHFLGDIQSEIQLEGNPAVIFLFGLQGSGKTTTCAKLASWYQKKGKSVLLVAADSMRPAAVEQLCTLGEKIGCDVYSNPKAKSSMEIIKETYKSHKILNKDIMIVDTAGRTELDSVLLKEVSEINATVKSCARILVIDAMTGQTAVTIAKNFHEVSNITGLIMSKADSDARGGAMLSVKTVVDVPIHFIGTGEGIDALEVFYPDRMASRILGMGDVVSLVEKVQKVTDEEEALRLERKIRKKSFTLQDYLDQFSQISQMGSLESIAEMLPGGASQQLNSIDMKQIKREESIILSMTPAERENERLIGASRRTRIARGSGVSVAQVHALLKKFEKTKNTMRKAIKNKKYQNQLWDTMNMSRL